MRDDGRGFLISAAVILICSGFWLACLWVTVHFIVKFW